MDGRKSFIFSWNKKHRGIHEKALLHYFDPSKKGQKFEYQPKSPSKVSTSDKASESENKNIPRERDDKYQVKIINTSYTAFFRGIPWNIPRFIFLGIPTNL